MAAYFFQFKPLLRKLEDVHNKSIGLIRFVSRLGTVECRSQGNRGWIRRGLKKNHGQVVKSGSFLYVDRRLAFAPGLNVGLSSIYSLYAKTAGRVVISTEKSNLDPESGLVRIRYPTYMPKYNKYISVIPEPQHRRFVFVESF